MINVVTVVIVVAVVVVIIVVDVDDGVASVRHRTSPLFSASHQIIRGLNFTTLMMGLELGGGGEVARSNEKQCSFPTVLRFYSMLAIKLSIAIYSVFYNHREASGKCLLYLEVHNVALRSAKVKWLYIRKFI